MKTSTFGLVALVFALTGCATGGQVTSSASEGARLALRYQLLREDNIADFAALMDAQRQVAASRSEIQPLSFVPMADAPGLVRDVASKVLPGVKVVGLPMHPVFTGALYQDVPETIVTEREAGRTYAARYAKALIEYYASQGIEPTGSGIASGAAPQKNVPTLTAEIGEYSFRIRFDETAQALCKSRGTECSELHFDGVLKVTLAGRKGEGYAMWGRGSDFSLPMDAAVALSKSVAGMRAWIPFASVDDVCTGGYFISEGRTVPVEEARIQNHCPTTQPR